MSQKHYEIIKGRTLFLHDIISFRDGGTKELHYREASENIYVCIDFRIGKRTGEVWVGYPEKPESVKIEDQNTLNNIKTSIEIFIKNAQFCLTDGKFTL